MEKEERFPIIRLQKISSRCSSQLQPAKGGFIGAATNKYLNFSLFACFFEKSS
jgi:hypothetical protein